MADSFTVVVILFDRYVGELDDRVFEKTEITKFAGCCLT
jgi:hypothetical protein